MKKCRHKKVILACAYHIEFEPDQEPFESGVIESCGIGAIIAESLMAHYCPKCKTFTDIISDGEITVEN